MNTEGLHPTLWRTCRVLVGRTRVRLLQTLIATPGITVSETAARLNLSLPRASQELRRINARGLLAVRRVGSEVRYRLDPDPLVADAAPLAASIRRALRRRGDTAVENFVRVARGFTHPRRITIVQRLMGEPSSRASLLRTTRIPLRSLKRHLRVLVLCRLVRRDGGRYRLLPARHPLQQSIAACLRRKAVGS